MRADAKRNYDRIVEVAREVFREQGYAGTGLKQITAAGGAPWGSLYHFFPGGKEQLGAEAVRHSGDRYLRLFDLVFERAEQDVVQSVRDFFALSADALRKSDWSDGCPIATVALEAGELRSRATVSFLQSSFGYRPYSAVLGAIRNKDEVTLHVDLVATP